MLKERLLLIAEQWILSLSLDEDKVYDELVCMRRTDYAYNNRCEAAVFVQMRRGYFTHTIRM